MNFLSTKGSNVKLDTSQFAGGSGLLDETTDDVQKALTAINLALDYASASYAGVMSSEDKIKLDGIESGAQVNNPLTTLQGNTFNNANQLVKLDSTGKLPVLDGSNLINVSSGPINLCTDVDTVTETPVIGDVLVWNGSNWVPDARITSAEPAFEFFEYTTTENQTVINGVDLNSKTLIIKNVSIVNVYHNGFKLSTSAYTYNSTSVTLVDAAKLNDVIRVELINTISNIAELSYGQWKLTSSLSNVTAGSVIPIFGTKVNGSLTSIDTKTFRCKAGITYKIECSITATMSSTASLIYGFAKIDDGTQITLNAYTSTSTNTSNAALVNHINEYVKFDTDTDISLYNKGTTTITTLYEIAGSCVISAISEYTPVIRDIKINGETVDTNGNVDLKGTSTLSSPKLGVEVLTEERHFITGKPIYKKTINFGTLPNTTTKYVSTGLTSIENIWISLDESYIYSPSNGQYYSTPLILSNQSIAGNWTVYIHGTTGDIAILTGADRTAYSAYVTVKYTKTTDTSSSPVKLIGSGTADFEMAHYSTSEVLTERRWVDGKPLYRKSFTGTLAASAVDVSIAHGITDADMIKVDDYYLKRNDNIVFSDSNNYYVSEASETHVNITGNYVTLNIGDGLSQYSNVAYVIIIEYTKTTDTADSPVHTLLADTTNIFPSKTSNAGKSLRLDANEQLEWFDDEYSLTETMTNKKWMGSRVYRKVFYYKFAASGVNDVTINTGLSLSLNKYRVTDFVAFLSNGNVVTASASMFTTDTSETRVYMNGSGQIAIYISDGDTTTIPNSEWYITVEYIKP